MNKKRLEGYKNCYYSYKSILLSGESHNDAVTWLYANEYYRYGIDMSKGRTSKAIEYYSK